MNTRKEREDYSADSGIPDISQSRATSLHPDFSEPSINRV